MRQGCDARLAQALDLVGRIYEAAADVTGWPRALEALSDATGSTGTVLWFHDFADASAQLGAASFACDVRIAPELMQRYAEHYTYVNPWMKRVEGHLPEGSIQNSSDVITDAELQRTEFYADWLRPQGLGYALGGAVLVRGSRCAMFSLLRPERAGPYREADTVLMRQLMPHLRRACGLHQRLAALQAQRCGVLAALDRLAAAVWLLDRDGCLLHANRAGRELDTRRDGLWIDPQGRPCAEHPGDQQALRRLVEATIAAAAGRSLCSDGALAVRRRAGRAPLQLMAYPLAHDVMLPGAPRRCTSSIRLAGRYRRARCCARSTA